MLRVIVILALIYLSATVAKAFQTSATLQSNRDEMIRVLSTLPSVMLIVEDQQRLDFGGKNLELAVTQAGAFYKDPDIAGHMADQVLSVCTDPVFQVQAQGLVWLLVEQGIGDLSIGKMWFYFLVRRGMIYTLSNQECGFEVRGLLSDTRFLGTRTDMTARLDTNTLREFYRVESKATRIGATKQLVRLSDRELLHIVCKVEVQLLNLIDATPDTPRLKSALRNIEAVDNTRAFCVGRRLYQAVFLLDQNDLRSELSYLGQP